MRDPHNGRHKSPGYLSHNQVLDLLAKGIRENPNHEILALRGKPNWLDSKVGSSNPEALTEAGWSALSQIFSFSCIERPTHLIDLAKTFVGTDRSQPIGAESLSAIEEIISEITDNHRDVTLRELSTLCSFLIALGRQDYAEGHRSIKVVRTRLDSSGPDEDVLEAVVETARAYLSVPQGTPHAHAEAFRRRMRTALQTGDDVSPANIALFYLETSDLPEEQRTVFRQTWPRVACQLDSVSDVIQQVADSISELRRINEYFDSIAHASNTSEAVAEAITHQFKNARDVANILAPQEKHLRLSGPDSDAAINKLGQGTDAKQLRILIEFSRRCQIPLKDAPDIFTIIPENAQQVVWNLATSGAPEFTQPIPEPPQAVPTIVTVLELLSPLLKTGETEPRVLQSYLALHERTQADPRLWSTELGTYFARRCAKKGIRAEDINELRMALALHYRLLKAGYPPEQSREIAWVFTAHKHYRESSSRKLTRALLASAPQQAFTSAMRELAQDPGITESEFQRALSFAARAFPHDWSPIFVLPSSWVWRGAFTFHNLKQTIANSHKTTPHEIHMELIRSADRDKTSETRGHLVTFLQSRDSQARTQALSALNTVYHLDQGPYPQYQGSTSSIHPDYRRMMNEVKGAYRGTFDMHYGFGHFTFECMTAPGAVDWMLVQFGFDVAIRVDRLHSTSKELYPGPGCLLSGMKLDRIFAKTPNSPDDPYVSFKKAWPWAANEFEDLAATRFLISRAVKAVIAPDLPKYYREGIHYSLVTWNDHFRNPNLDAATLVPTVVLLAALKGKHSAIQAPGDRPTVTPYNSVHDEALSFPALAAECAARGLNILNLGWASNLGGLCNAYPPLSAPYFEWEGRLAGQGRGKDRVGHVHKSFISGRNRSKLDEATKQLLVPLREAHTSVRTLSTAYFNLHDLFRLSLAMWHKGLTVTEGMGEMVEPEFRQDGEGRLNPHELRMLHQAHRWHRLHERGVRDRDAFPVLCIAPALDNWSKVRSPLMLDTFDLTLRIPEQELIQLTKDSGGHDAYEATVWSRYVKPLYFTRSDRDLQFLDRRTVTYDDTGSKR